MSRLSTLAIALGMLMTAVASQAQSSSPDESVCLGFAFGSWTPALDWHAAGHGAMPDSSTLQHAANGRDWAAPGSASESDSLLILYPSWWPAGVGVALPNRSPAPGDTVVGRATAFRADGDRKSPTAAVRAWRVACGHA